MPEPVSLAARRDQLAAAKRQAEAQSALRRSAWANRGRRRHKSAAISSVAISKNEALLMDALTDALETIATLRRSLEQARAALRKDAR